MSALIGTGWEWLLVPKKTEVHDLHVDAADLLRAGLGAAKPQAHWTLQWDARSFIVQTKGSCRSSTWKAWKCRLSFCWKGFIDSSNFAAQDSLATKQKEYPQIAAKAWATFRAAKKTVSFKRPIQPHQPHQPYQPYQPSYTYPADHNNPATVRTVTAVTTDTLVQKRQAGLTQPGNGRTASRSEATW